MEAYEFGNIFFLILFGREWLKQSKTNKSGERDFRACDRWKVDSHGGQ